MIPVLAALLIAAAPPLAVPIEGLRLIPASGVAGATGLNLRQVRFEGGAHDALLFTDHLLRWPYDVESAVPYPEDAAGARADAWGGKLYLLGHGKLRMYRLAETDWQAEKQWPIETDLSLRPPPDPLPSPEAFLYRLAPTGAPDILLAESDGLWALSLQEDGVYRGTEPLGLWPPPSYEPARDQVIWPPAARRLASPARQGRYRVFMDGPAAIVLTRAAADNGKAVYTSAIWSRNVADSAWPAVRFPPVPDFVQPCRLNTNKAIHFAGGRWVSSASSIVPMPIYESWVSLDGGEHFERRRSRALQRGGTRTNFADVDGDGDQDWITHEPATFDHGERDALNQFLSSDTLRLRVNVYLQDAQRFAAKPALSKTLRIGLGGPAVRGGPQFERYAAGQIYQFGGDLNGDGAKDLVVRAESETLQIYLARDGSFPDSPDAALSLTASDEFGVLDVDNDGLADIVRMPRNEDTGETAAALVHFSGADWP